MYITQELFGSPHSYSHFESSSAHIHTRNIMTTDGSIDHQSLGKRKRRLEVTEGPNVRPRHNEETALEDHTQGSQESYRSSSPSTTCGSRPPLKPSPETTSSRLSDPRPTKQPRRIAPKKTLFQKQPSFLMDVEEPNSVDSGIVPPHSSTLASIPLQIPTSDLRPCHICQKAPKRKSDMDNYLSCSRCLGRACFICARNCVKCHKDLCSGCCAEVGEEGDAWCVGCLQK